MRKAMLLGLCVTLSGMWGCICPMANTPHGARTTGVIHADFRAPLSMETSEPAKWEPLGRVKGHSEFEGILGLFAWGDYGFAAAYDDALKKSGADALVDYQCDENVFHFIGIYVCARTTVSGLAVREIK